MARLHADTRLLRSRCLLLLEQRDAAMREAQCALAHFQSARQDISEEIPSGVSLPYGEAMLEAFFLACVAEILSKPDFSSSAVTGFKSFSDGCL
eukprot:4264487-Amphidinium_carterae.1